MPLCHENFIKTKNLLTKRENYKNSVTPLLSQKTKNRLMRESHNLTAMPLLSTNNLKQTKMPKRESRNITATPYCHKKLLM